MSDFIKKENVEWKNVKILKSSDEGPVENHTYEYEFEIPVPLANWDVFDYWEKERFHSMRDNLSQGEVLFDIGVEQGWCNLIYAQFVGAENMVLIEPTKEFWPNIRQTWEKNGFAHPKGFYDGLLSDKTTEVRSISNLGEWPKASEGDQIDKNKYQYIHDNEDHVPEMTLDDYVGLSKIIPNALTMDVEGAELLILRGAEKTLREYKPKVWVSVHPDLGLRDYGIAAQQTLDFMKELGYKSEHLATDHEEHWFFYV